MEQIQNQSMGTETIICKVNDYKSSIKKIQEDLVSISKGLENTVEGKEYAELIGKRWSLNQVLQSKKRMLKKWEQAFSDVEKEDPERAKTSDETEGDYEGF